MRVKLILPFLQPDCGDSGRAGGSVWPDEIALRHPHRTNPRDPEDQDKSPRNTNRLTGVENRSTTAEMPTAMASPTMTKTAKIRMTLMDSPFPEPETPGTVRRP